MGIYSRYTAAFLIILATIASPSATAATLHPVPSIAKALAAGPTGVMPSGLTVLRSQQLGTMLLKSQVQLAMGSTSIAVTRGASLSVGALARGAVAILKNSSPPKIIASAVIGAAVAAIPGAKVHEGELILAGEGPAVLPGSSSDYAWTAYHNREWQTGMATPEAACRRLEGPTTTSAGSMRSTYFHSTKFLQDGRFECLFQVKEYQSGKFVDVGEPTSDIKGQALALRTGQQCPDGSSWDSKGGVCRGPGDLLPFTDWDALEGAIPASDPSPADVTDFWFNLCGGNGECMGSYTSSPTLTGPVSLPSTQTTTTSAGPAGTTTTTKTTQTDLDYSNPDGVVSRDKTTTTTTNPDGSQSTDITEDTGPIVGAQPSETLEGGTFNDSPFPEVEPFYDQKYPDGFGGVWNTRAAEFEDSAFMEFLGSFVPSFSGSCPAWSINVNIASWANFGVHDFQTLCWVFDFIKIVLLVSAAFLCRALMFGG